MLGLGFVTTNINKRKSAYLVCDAASQDVCCKGGPPAAWQGPVKNQIEPSSPSFNIPQYIRARYCKRYKKT
jgi:hypothetical protein